MAESRFKVGDEVYLASTRGGEIGTIQKLNESSGVTVVNFGENRVSVLTKDDLYLASEVNRNALPTSSYEKLLSKQSEIFKLGAAIMECHFGYGIVVEVLPSGMACVDFKFYGQRHIETRTFNAWHATEADKDWMPRQPEALPEPMYESEELTLDGLQREVEAWEHSVKCFDAGFDCSEEYTHDLFVREGLHGVLNGFARQNLDVPDALKVRIDGADKRFIELTFEIENHVWGSSDIYDKTIFWYYYRWLIK